MTKGELIRHISNETQVVDKDISTIIDLFLNQIKQRLESGDNVKLHGFGSFYLQDRKARTALDPRNQELISVPAKKVIKFQSARKLKQRIN